MDGTTVYDTTRGCTEWCHCKEETTTQVPVKPNLVELETSHSFVTACRKLDGMAAWIKNGVAAVFFTTLERCSCIYLDTKDDLDDANDNYLPLIISSNGPHLPGNVHEEVLPKNGMQD